MNFNEYALLVSGLNGGTAFDLGIIREMDAVMEHRKDGENTFASRAEVGLALGEDRVLDTWGLLNDA
jgi:hypothetical protein